MTEAVIWLVIWVVSAAAGTGLIYLALSFLGGVIFMAIDKPLLVFVSIVVAWASAIAWFIFAAIQVVLQVISVVQMASSGA